MKRSSMWIVAMASNGLLILPPPVRDHIDG